MDQAELNSTKENQTGLFTPTLAYKLILPQENRNKIFLYLLQVALLCRTPRSYFLDPGDSTGLFYLLAREYCNGCH